MLCVQTRLTYLRIAQPDFTALGVTLTRAIQAADFMGDDVTLGEVARRYAGELAQLPFSAHRVQPCSQHPAVEVRFQLSMQSYVCGGERSAAGLPSFCARSVKLTYTHAACSVQVLKRASPNVARRILLEAPVSLLRLLALLPPALHTLAIESRTHTDADSGARTLTLADSKDLPPAGVADALGAFALHANSLQGLRALVMTHACGEHVALNALVRALPLLTSLTSIDLSVSQHRDCQTRAAQGCDAVVRATASLQNLAALDLSGMRCGVEGVQAFAAWPLSAAALTSLGLAGCALGNAGLELLPTALERMPSLQRLDVSANNGDVEQLAEHFGSGALLWHGPTHLRDLCLSDSDLPFDAVLRHIAALTRLRMTAHDYANVHVTWADLQRGTQLRELRLAAAPSFRQAAQHALTALTALALRVPPADPAVWLLATVESLSKLTQLRDFSLTSEDPPGVGAHEAGPEAVQALSACVGSLAQLTQLELCGVVFSRDAGSPLLQQVARLKSLQSLTLGLFRNVPVFIAELRSTLAELTALHFVDPGGDRLESCTSFADLQVWAIASAAPHLRRLSVEHKLHFAESNLQNAPLAPTLTQVAFGFGEGVAQIRPVMLHAVLVSMTALRRLELRGLHFDGYQAGMTWRAVSQCTLVTHLMMQHGGQVAADAFIAAAALHLPQLAHLRVLRLFGFACHMPTEPYAAGPSIEAALLSLTALQKLAMVAVTPTGLPQLVRRLCRCLPRLRGLGLQLCELAASPDRDQYVAHHGSTPAWVNGSRDEMVEPGCRFGKIDLAERYGVRLTWWFHEASG